MPGPRRACLGKLGRGRRTDRLTRPPSSPRFRARWKRSPTACHCGFPCSSPAASSSISASPMEAVSLKRRSSVGKGAVRRGGGRPARVAGGRRGGTQYRGGESVAETRGRRPWVPERQLINPTLPPGQAYAKDQGSAEDDDADNRRFDGNPDE